MLERTPETVKTLTVGAANTPYKSLIVPIFFFTLIVFGPAVTSATQTVLKASNVEQPKLSSSTETAMQILKWVPLETHRGKHVCKLVKKCLTYTVPHFLRYYFTSNRDVVSRITRQSNYPRIAQFTT